MLALPFTSITAASLAMIMLPLTLQVSLRRVAIGSVVFGDGGDDVLRRRIRAFGNFTEYTPLCLILLALLEAQGAGATWLDNGHPPRGRQGDSRSRDALRAIASPARYSHADDLWCVPRARRLAADNGRVKLSHGAPLLGALASTTSRL